MQPGRCVKNLRYDATVGTTEDDSKRILAALPFLSTLGILPFVDWTI